MKVRMYNVGCSDSAICGTAGKSSGRFQEPAITGLTDTESGDVFDADHLRFTTISHKSLLPANFQLDHIS